jgi:DNA-binding CsgD family transcriptional regulator
MTVIDETPTVGNGRRNPRRQATSTELQTTQKRADAIRLRIAGCSYDQIANQLGLREPVGGV